AGGRSPKAAAFHAAPTAKTTTPANASHASHADSGPRPGKAPAPKPATDAPTAASNAAKSGQSLDPDAAEGEPATGAPPTAHEAAPDASTLAAHVLEAASDAQPKTQQPSTNAQPTQSAQQQPVAPEVRFADDNHPSIVAGVRGQLMPNGGTMHIRLDPPEL